MENENTNNTITTEDTNTTTTTPMSATTYVEQLENLRATTISKDEYERVVAENRTLANSLAANVGTKKSAPATPTYDIAALEKAYKATFGTNSNLGPAKAALELRDAILATTGKDVFVANAHNPKFHAKQEAYQSAENVAELLRSCIADCGGSDEVFTSLLRDRTDDDPSFLRAIAARNKDHKNR